MRVVLDTNVLVSALLFHGRLGRIAELLWQGSICPCFVQTTFEELENVFTYPKLQRVFIALRLDAAQIVAAVAARSIILADPIVIPTVIPDKPDNYLLACAKAVQAACIVTGDKAVLRIRAFEGIPIVSPTEFLQHLA